MKIKVSICFTIILQLVPGLDLPADALKWRGNGSFTSNGKKKKKTVTGGLFKENNRIKYL